MQRGARMKKYAAVIFALIMLAVSTSSTYSYAAKAVYGGQSATGWLKDVRYSSNGNNESTIITVQNYTDYSIMKLSDPQRVVLDIFNVAAPGKQQIINADGKVIKRVRYAQFDPYTTRIVLDVNDETEYGVEKTDSGLVLYIGEKVAVDTSAVNADTSDASSQDKPSQQSDSTNADKPSQQSDSTNQDNQSRHSDTSRVTSSGTDLNDMLLLAAKESVSSNIEYHNNGDRVHFILQDVVLTNGDEFLKELYTGNYDDSGKKYTMTFATGQADLGNGVMEINDPYLRSVEVKTNKLNGTTTIIFNGTGKYTYFAYTRGTSGVTSITVIKPVTNEQKLVVIDAGHGGVASGAVYGNLLEKDLNLDIAKRLNELLKKKGVKTYMLREDDSSMGNYERAYIANNLNAKLYLSIHNNGEENRNYRGTMTLYCPSNSSNSFTGKSFAGIIQQAVLASLRTVDRKVIGRADLIVLKATTMPAALVEVGYMTNITDRSNLQKTSFRQKAAQALCDSIVKALPKVK